MDQKQVSLLALGALLFAFAVKCIPAQHIDGEHYHDHGPSYDFHYEVHDPHHHDFKSQHETKIGGLVKGYYTLKETDGSTREVVYAADKHSGFNAVVTKDGHQVFPEIITPAQYAIPVHHLQPKYQQQPQQHYQQQYHQLPQQQYQQYHQPVSHHYY